MKIAIASGKGGTGKTTVAVNLALAAARPVQLLDCDVEAPNSHLFLRPAIDETFRASIQVPLIDADKCDDCGECGSFCRFKAIVILPGNPLVFPELCHGCGGCARICTRDAITETDREIGTVEIGRSGQITLIRGLLDVGVAMSPPLIRSVKARASADGLVLVDAPPGASCPMVAAVSGCDQAVLVTEPTPFGLNDLRVAVETIRELKIPFGVVINRSDAGDDRTVEYCTAEGIDILAEIPDDRRIAVAYSRGEPLVDAVPEFKPVFESLLERLQTSSRETRRSN
jgi:MinD superfamily P-loop ATPase